MGYKGSCYYFSVMSSLACIKYMLKSGLYVVCSHSNSCSLYHVVLVGGTVVTVCYQHKHCTR